MAERIDTLYTAELTLTQEVNKNLQIHFVRLCGHGVMHMLKNGGSQLRRFGIDASVPLHEILDIMNTDSKAQAETFAYLTRATNTPPPVPAVEYRRRPSDMPDFYEIGAFRSEYASVRACWKREGGWIPTAQFALVDLHGEMVPYLIGAGGDQNVPTAFLDMKDRLGRANLPARIFKDIRDILWEHFPAEFDPIKRPQPQALLPSALPAVIRASRSQP